MASRRSIGKRRFHRTHDHYDFGRSNVAVYNRWFGRKGFPTSCRHNHLVHMLLGRGGFGKLIMLPLLVGGGGTSATGSLSEVAHNRGAAWVPGGMLDQSQNEQHMLGYPAKQQIWDSPQQSFNPQIPDDVVSWSGACPARGAPHPTDIGTNHTATHAILKWFTDPPIPKVCAQIGAIRSPGDVWSTSDQSHELGHEQWRWLAAHSDGDGI